MKVILLENIDGLGAVGQEVKVKEGYARNFLIPRGKAVEASSANVKALKAKIDSRIKKEVVTKNEALLLAEKLGSITLNFDMKAGQDGKLFGSITSLDICEALKEKGFELDKKKVASEPIRHTGSHSVSIKLYHDVMATIKVEVREAA
jgi:large subunit ribosomal protein L9